MLKFQSSYGDCLWENAFVYSGLHALYEFLYESFPLRFTSKLKKNILVRSTFKNLIFLNPKHVSQALWNRIVVLVYSYFVHFPEKISEVWNFQIFCHKWDSASFHKHRKIFLTTTLIKTSLEPFNALSKVIQDLLFRLFRNAASRLYWIRLQKE